MDTKNILPQWPGPFQHKHNTRSKSKVSRGNFTLMANGAIQWTPPEEPAPAPAPVPPASAPALAREPIPGSCASAPLDLSVGDGWVHAEWEWYDEGEDEED